MFYPKVRKRAKRLVLLLMNNAPGHFSAFKRYNIKMMFFPPNCTSWKQPCNMGIIAALKKAINIYSSKIFWIFLDENFKARKRERAKRLPGGAAGVAYGNPTHMLDAAPYIKLA